MSRAKKTYKAFTSTALAGWFCLPEVWRDYLLQASWPPTLLARVAFPSATPDFYLNFFSFLYFTTPLAFWL